MPRWPGLCHFHLSVLAALWQALAQTGSGEAKPPLRGAVLQLQPGTKLPVQTQADSLVLGRQPKPPLRGAAHPWKPDSGTPARDQANSLSLGRQFDANSQVWRRSTVSALGWRRKQWSGHPKSSEKRPSSVLPLHNKSIGPPSSAAPAPNKSSGEILLPSHARRLTASLGPTQQHLSLRWASNIALARISASQVALAFSDYGYGSKGSLSTCQVVAGSLTCGTSTRFTTEPVHPEPQSLAMSAIYSDTVFIAWKQGSSPFIGHVQACRADASLCGPELSVPLEWGSVATLALSRYVAVFAYSDVQRGHRGSVVRCQVANMNLNCLLAHNFELLPTSHVSLAALTSDGFPYLQETADFLIGYQVGTGTERSGRIQACELVGLGLVCYPSNSLTFTSGSTAGISLMGLASDAFIVGYTDTELSCDHTRAALTSTRRRTLDVCTVDPDGHPSIGRVKVCRARFRFFGVTSPVLECSDSSVVDDTYTTGTPHFARWDGSTGTGTTFLAMYTIAHNGAGQEQARARSCTAPALPDSPALPSPAHCSIALVVNNHTSRWPSVAAVADGYVVSFDDYGGSGYASARLVT